MSNRHVDRVLELVDQATQRPGDVAYPDEPADATGEECWRCTAAPGVTRVGLCESCDAFMREEKSVDARWNPFVVDSPDPSSEEWWEAFASGAAGPVLFRWQWTPGGGQMIRLPQPVPGPEAPHDCEDCGGELRFECWHGVEVAGAWEWCAVYTCRSCAKSATAATSGSRSSAAAPWGSTTTAG